MNYFAKNCTSRVGSYLYNECSIGFVLVACESLSFVYETDSIRAFSKSWVSTQLHSVFHICYSDKILESQEQTVCENIFFLQNESWLDLC